MLRAGAAERNPKKAILIVNATGSNKKMDEPIFIINGKESWEYEPKFGFNFALVDAQTLEVLPNGYAHFDAYAPLSTPPLASWHAHMARPPHTPPRLLTSGRANAGRMADWLEKIENGELPLQQQLADETKHIFVLMSVMYAPLLTPPLASWHALLTPPLAW